MAVILAVFAGVVLALMMILAAGLMIGDGGLQFVTFCEGRWETDACARNLLGPAIVYFVISLAVGMAFGAAQPRGRQLTLIVAALPALVALLAVWDAAIGPQGEVPPGFTAPMIGAYMVMPLVALLVGAYLGGRRWRGAKETPAT